MERHRKRASKKKEWEQVLYFEKKWKKGRSTVGGGFCETITWEIKKKE